MRLRIFLSVITSIAIMTSLAKADDSAAGFSLPASTGQNKAIPLRQGQQFFPLRSGNLSMSSRPLIRMSPPAQMVKSVQTSKSLARPLPQAGEQSSFKPAPKSGDSAMSREQAEQILSLFSSAE